MASNVGLVHQESLAEAIERENSDLATAIMQSKAEASPVLNSECVDVLRLTRHAQAAEVAQALRDSEELQECRALAEESGCALQPDWAGGAWFFVPPTRASSTTLCPKPHRYGCSKCANLDYII